ncbi:MAG: hypothetical protein JKX76_01530 [Colwellia sp.]|nr:hypothetical protein [Colwellia sp.]
MTKTQAVEIYKKTGERMCMWAGARLHRPSLHGPANIRCYKNDNNDIYKSQSWWYNGSQHRPSLEGPTLINHLPNCNCVIETHITGFSTNPDNCGSQYYYNHGKISRPSLEGPAFINHRIFEWRNNGKINRPIYEGPVTIRTDRNQQGWSDSNQDLVTQYEKYYGIEFLQSLDFLPRNYIDEWVAREERIKNGDYFK